MYQLYKDDRAGPCMAGETDSKHDIHESKYFAWDIYHHK